MDYDDNIKNNSIETSGTTEKRSELYYISIIALCSEILLLIIPVISLFNVLTNKATIPFSGVLIIIAFLTLSLLLNILFLSLYPETIHLFHDKLIISAIPKFYRKVIYFNQIREIKILINRYDVKAIGIELNNGLKYHLNSAIHSKRFIETLAMKLSVKNTTGEIYHVEKFSDYSKQYFHD